MKRILVKSLVSLVMSTVLLIGFTLIKSYFQPLLSIVAVGLLHIPVFLISLIGLIRKDNNLYQILPHIISIVLYGTFAWLTWMPDKPENDFRASPYNGWQDN
ncbi:MAG: hypothetical protein GC178_08655 [Flavobacteriales bacterium]|nr:hypothetical protein [Flavobacteriales bacterium]